jgi:CheY-like chemotaxis protein
VSIARLISAEPMPPSSVLLVEDDEDLAELLQELFHQVGWDVRLERNGAEALRALEQSRPDVMVTDCMMPQMGGLELLQRIGEIPGLANLPVVLMSGADAMLEGVRRPSQRTMRKPFDPEKLVDLVRQMLAAA